MMETDLPSPTCINRPTGDDQGLFGYADSDADIKNLGVVNATVSGDELNTPLHQTTIIQK